MSVVDPTEIGDGEDKAFKEMLAQPKNVYKKWKSVSTGGKGKRKRVAGFMNTRNTHSSKVGVGTSIQVTYDLTKIDDQ